MAALHADYSPGGWVPFARRSPRLDPAEIRAIAAELAPLVADILESRFGQRPEWAFSIGEAAAFAQVEEHVIRDAIADGRLAHIKIGRSLRIKRSDLFG